MLPKAIEAIHLAGLAAAVLGLNLQFEHHAGLVASSGHAYAMLPLTRYSLQLLIWL